MNRIFHPNLSAQYLNTYRQSLYNRIARTLITSLSLAWYDDNKLSMIARRVEVRPESVSILDFMCNLSNTSIPEIRPNGVHLPTFLATLFKERGNYGVAETKGRREYGMMYQAAMMAYPPTQRENSAAGLAKDPTSSMTWRAQQLSVTAQPLYGQRKPTNMYTISPLQRNHTTILGSGSDPSQVPTRSHRCPHRLHVSWRDFGNMIQ